MNQREEKQLRSNIRSLIEVVKQKRAISEQKTKDALKELMVLELQAMLSERQVSDTNPAPNKSTGINVLEDLLKKIIPVAEIDYKQLTTDSDQRESFRAHVINAVVNTLTPVDLNTDALEDDLREQDINVDMTDTEDDKFIDIRTDVERSKDEEEEEIDPRKEFSGDLGGDETGRNMAYTSFKKIETSVIDSYEMLSNEEDQEIFYDYLIANLKLYFDKFEEELDIEVEEPTNQAYDTATSGGPAPGAEELPGEEELEELDINL